MNALPAVSVLCSISMLISDYAASPMAARMPVSDIVAPAMLIMFSAQAGRRALPDKATAVFIAVILAVILLVLALRIVSVVWDSPEKGYGCLAYLPAVLAVALLLQAVSGRKANKWKNEKYILYLSVSFTLLVLSQIYVQSAVWKTVFTSVLFSAAVWLYVSMLVMAVKDPGCRSRHDRHLPSDSGISSHSGHGRGNSQFKELFERIKTLFETEKPYLDADLTVGDVARMLYTNKVYVSRAINDYTDKNFCQYVNHYRIMYSIQAFKENPRLRVSELAEMCGFRTMVSYNMAFRLVMNESPGEWGKKVRREAEGMQCMEGDSKGDIE